MDNSLISNIDLLSEMTRRLKAEIVQDADQDDIDAALRELEKAVADQSDTAPTRRFEPQLGETATQPPPEDALAAIAWELHAGNVLLAVSQAVPSRNTASLDLAMQGLVVTRDALDPKGPERRRFESMLTTAEAGIDEQAAPDAFRQRTSAAMEGLVKDSAQVIGTVLTALKKLDPSEVLKGIGNFTSSADDLEKAGRLMKQGYARIQNAYRALVNLIGEDALKKINAKIEQIWTDFQNGKYTQDMLRLIFDQQAIAAEVAHLLADPRTDRQGLLRGCDELAPLGPRFGKQMALLGGIVSAITVASAVLAFTPVAVHAAPFIGGAYLLVIGAALVIGREFAGVDYSLHWVRGVGEIARALSPSRSE